MLRFNEIDNLHSEHRLTLLTCLTGGGWGHGARRADQREPQVSGECLGA